MARLLTLMLAALLLAPAAAHAAGPPVYPDLQTLPPRDLRLERTDVSIEGSGVMHNVLRFSNTVTNQGQGRLEIHGTFGTDPNSAPAVQWVYDAAGNVVEKDNVGTYTWHQAHQHYHFDNWGRYELWTKAGWDSYVAQGRPAVMQPDITGAKTTSCVMDEEFISTLSTTPWGSVYPASGCFPDSRGEMIQGLSSGWGDTYDYYRQDQ